MAQDARCVPTNLACVPSLHLKVQEIVLTRLVIDCENAHFGLCAGAAFGAGSRKRQRAAAFPANAAGKHACPVVNCGRVFDNTSLLDGHLKRQSFELPRRLK